MNAIRAAGFTLIELLIVVSIIGLLAAAFLPDLLSSKASANVAADGANLSQQYKWLETYKQKLKRYPSAGGHKFLLDLWVRKVVDHTQENFDRFWTPGLREQDPRYAELRPLVQRQEVIWEDLDSLTSEDTHYAARAREHLLGMNKANEVWVATDNEIDWNFTDGTINMLVAGGSVRSLSLQELEDLYQWPGMEEVFRTYGDESPHPGLRKLDL
ncbi:MAG: type II secretion system protein [Planctomycetota bacterium]|nr:type II secretion system protein [Planctomycetota bacterium]